MTQTATVERVIDSKRAEISVVRKTACGHDCEQCAGCGVSGAAVKMIAATTFPVKPGDKVMVESNTRLLLGIVALVYLIPVVFFFLGYFLPGDRVGETGRIVIAAAAFLLGFVPAVLYDRKRRGTDNGITCTIVSFQ